MKPEFSQKIPQKHFMKSRKVGAESFRTDSFDAGNSRFSQF